MSARCCAAGAAAACWAHSSQHSKRGRQRHSSNCSPVGSPLRGWRSGGVLISYEPALQGRSSSCSPVGSLWRDWRGSGGLSSFEPTLQGRSSSCSPVGSPLRGWRGGGVLGSFEPTLQGRSSSYPPVGLLLRGRRRGGVLGSFEPALQARAPKTLFKLLACRLAIARLAQRRRAELTQASTPRALFKLLTCRLTIARRWHAGIIRAGTPSACAKGALQAAHLSARHCAAGVAGACLFEPALPGRSASCSPAGSLLRGGRGGGMLSSYELALQSACAKGAP